MKTALKSFMVFFFLFAWLPFIQAQQKSEWKQAFARADGLQIYQGVEILFTTGICENRSAVFVKMINHNEYPVSVEWNDQVMDKNYEWHNNLKNIPEKKNILLNANETLEGKCAEQNPQLVIYVNEFVNSYDTFSYYRSSSPTINKTSK